MTNEKKVTEAEKLLYSLSAIKDILKMLECDVEVTMTLKNGHTETFDCYKEIEKCVVDFVKRTKPYKFEDLKPNMWVWDNKNKLYVQIEEDFDEGNGYIIIRYYEDSYNSNCERTRFEENRFYRKEVEE